MKAFGFYYSSNRSEVFAVSQSRLPIQFLLRMTPIIKDPGIFIVVIFLVPHNLLLNGNTLPVNLPFKYQFFVSFLLLLPLHSIACLKSFVDLLHSDLVSELFVLAVVVILFTSSSVENKTMAQNSIAYCGLGLERSFCVNFYLVRLIYQCFIHASRIIFNGLADKCWSC